jgi:hypothetical protein
MNLAKADFTYSFGVLRSCVSFGTLNIVKSIFEIRGLNASSYFD